jgi:hypothetical protein
MAHHIPDYKGTNVHVYLMKQVPTNAVKMSSMALLGDLHGTGKWWL